MTEARLVENIKKYLKSVPELFFWKEHGGQYGTAGIPDLIVCYRGKFLAFEVKTPQGKPTLLQTVTLRQIARAGGYATIVRSVQEVKDIITALEKEGCTGK